MSKHSLIPFPPLPPTVSPQPERREDKRALPQEIVHLKRTLGKAAM